MFQKAVETYSDLKYSLVSSKTWIKPAYTLMKSMETDWCKERNQAGNILDESKSCV